MTLLLPTPDPRWPLAGPFDNTYLRAARSARRTPRIEILNLELSRRRADGPFRWYVYDTALNSRRTRNAQDSTANYVVRSSESTYNPSREVLDKWRATAGMRGP